MAYKDVFGNDVDGNGKPLGEPLGKPPSKKQTPEEHAAKELEKELGWCVKIRQNDGLPTVYEGEFGELGPASSDVAQLWFIALRQRVELNKLNESK